MRAPLPSRSYLVETRKIAICRIHGCPVKLYLQDDGTIVPDSSLSVGAPNARCPLFQDSEQISNLVGNLIESIIHVLERQIEYRWTMERTLFETFRILRPFRFASKSSINSIPVMRYWLS